MPPVTLLRAREVMTTPVVTISSLATAREAFHLMRETNATCLVVEKRHPDDTLAIITLRDLAKGVIAPGRDPDQVHVYELMTKPVVTVRPEMDIRHVAGLFVNLHLRRAPVEDADGALAGIISLSDIVMRSGALF